MQSNAPFQNNNEEKIHNIIQGLSPERLAKYSQLSPNNLKRQIELYTWNTKLSESLYAPLQGLEIITRNYFDRTLQEKFDQWWININLVHPQTRILSNTLSMLKEKNKSLNNNNLIADLSFGFWTGLLHAKYENNLWRSCLYYAFKNKPKPFIRKNVHHEYHLLKLLRNRIAHHEPILRSDLPNHYFRIIKMINWFCKDTALWIESQSSFIEAWHQPINPFINHSDAKFLRSQNVIAN